MTIVAVWCRHKDDNVIGIGANIPWRVSSDFKRFRRLTEGQNLVAGEKTYESFPNRTLPNRKIYVLSFNPDYEVSDAQNHFVVTDVKEFQDFKGALYLAGGASVYKTFMTAVPKLLPDIVVDSVYQGELNPELQGEKIDITSCVETLHKKYQKISNDYEEDGVVTSVWLKKGDFVDCSVIKHIFNAIENKGEK